MIMVKLLDEEVNEVDVEQRQRYGRFYTFVLCEEGKLLGPNMTTFPPPTLE